MVNGTAARIVALHDTPEIGQIASALHHLLHASGHVEQPAPSEPNEFRLFCAENIRGGPYLGTKPPPRPRPDLINHQG